MSLQQRQPTKSLSKNYLGQLLPYRATELVINGITQRSGNNDEIYRELNICGNVNY